MNTHRNSIHLVDDAPILAHESFEGDQYILQVSAPVIARKALPGSFAHLRVSPERPMRRPISIMRTDPESGMVEFLYKAVGEGTRLLAERRVGERLSILGPIGRPFEFHPERPRPLLIGGGVGMPPMIFSAQQLKDDARFSPFVILGSEVPFPFRSRPSRLMLPGMPDGVIGCMPLLEDWGVASRLASLRGYPGCFEGYVTELARHWLEALEPAALAEVEVFACGPHPMLESVAALARAYDLPCQVSLEEFMACAVGGCAGCVVEVQTDSGPAMQRVCVDGPVFDARSVFA
ncbi:MAG: dihydroorotate dehydrogenase electron transfer subunit [Gammaproteobacteria bacterium]|nr:MAG: dihydroorotate dehydrogenase electron transfer subunit [Gammaproteobacteria bacterium]